MIRSLKVALASALLLVGSSVAFAADHNPGGRGQTPNDTNAGITGKSRSSEQDDRLLLDNMATGSITNCDNTHNATANCPVTNTEGR